MILENHAAAKRFGRFALNGDFMWIASWIAHAVIYQAGRTQWPTGEFAKLNAVPRQINKFGRISKCGVLPNAFHQSHRLALLSGNLRFIYPNASLS